MTDPADPLVRLWYRTSDGIWHKGDLVCRESADIWVERQSELWSPQPPDYKSLMEFKWEHEEPPHDE